MKDEFHLIFYDSIPTKIEDAFKYDTEDFPFVCNLILCPHRVPSHVRHTATWYMVPSTGRCVGCAFYGTKPPVQSPHKRQYRITDSERCTSPSLRYTYRSSSVNEVQILLPNTSCHRWNLLSSGSGPAQGSPGRPFKITCLLAGSNRQVKIITSCPSSRHPPPSSPVPDGDDSQVSQRSTNLPGIHPKLLVPSAGMLSPSSCRVSSREGTLLLPADWLKKRLQTYFHAISRGAPDANGTQKCWQSIMMGVGGG